VLTRDLVPTDITVGLTYGIDVEWEAREGIRPLSRDERYAIQAFHVRAANWLEELKTVAESAVRTIVGKRGFRYATAPAYRKIIETEIANNMQFTAKEWGIRVYRMHLISIQPKEHVVTAREQRFISDTNAQTLERYEIARAKAWKEALNQLSEAYALAARNGLPDQIILRELLRRLMEQATSHATTQSMFPRELRHLFDDVDAVALSSPNGSSAAGANTPGP
jgi:regulator of protease activity HflC (stomatin/prohibitin superfamily)